MNIRHADQALDKVETRMKKDYCDVIDLIINDGINWKEVVLALAKDEPGLLLKYVNGNDDETYVISLRQEEEILNIAKQNKIAGIKKYREYTKCGLKDAKTFVDNLIDNNISAVQNMPF